MTLARPFQIIPAIDLRGGRVVRLRQGDFAQETAYDIDPPSAARAFAASGARIVHVVDLDGARTGTPIHAAQVADIVAAVGPGVAIEVAGGLRDERAVTAILAAGAARAVVGTAALRDPSFAGQLIRTHGSERIVAAIDTRDGHAVGYGWTTDHDALDTAAAIDRLWAEGMRTFEVTAIDRDGQLAGPDLDLYGRLIDLRRGSIVASGGIASVDDLRAVRDIGCVGAIVGRALYEGRFSLREALHAVTDAR